MTDFSLTSAIKPQTEHTSFISGLKSMMTLQLAAQDAGQF